MKKLFYMISAVALMASFASCNKIEQENAPVVDGTTTLTVSATVPQTKTYINSDKVRWSANDVIAVLAEGYESVMSSLVPSACETHDFSVQGWYPGVTPQYAAFTGPYTSDANYDPYKPVWNEDGTIRMTVRGTQPIFNEDSFSKTSNISLGVLTENDGVYSTVLRNVCGLIKFTLTNPTQYVAIEDVAGKPMAGKVDVSMIGGVPQAVPAADEGKIYLTSKINASNETLPAGTYYAVVIPGTYTPKVTITPVEGEEIVLTAKSSVEIKRNEYVDFGTIDQVITSPDDSEASQTLTLDFGGWSFVEEKPTTIHTTTDAGEVFTLIDTDYQIVIVNNDGTSNGYKWRSSVHGLQVNQDANGLFSIALPALTGMELISVSIDNPNGKYFSILNSGNGTVASTDGQTPNGTVWTLTIPSPVANSTYYLTTGSKNAQIKKVVLDYRKAE